MSNVSYDLDTSGGLMPLIKALIKPPDEEVSVSKAKKPQHPYYKRPGKGHNHDSCDACGEGGDLICCDRCPASFHLGCYDPPLEESDIPAGSWLCRECRAADEPSSTRSSRAHSPAEKSDGEKKTRSLRNNRTNSKKKSKEEEEEVKKESEKQSEAEKELSPMEVLVRAARVMNPRQFELPSDMRIPYNFPGTEKEGVSEVVSYGSCFVCGGSSRAAPLLRCDYCPLLYHQDCLDPPLTSLPTGRWMCPNHVEQYIDWKLVRSVSASERVALWQRFAGPLDHHQLKVDFLRRARNPNPRFRIKVPAEAPRRVLVPDMVRHHYRHPPPLQPSRREYVRCQNVLKNLCSSSIAESSDEEDAKHAICVNMECPSYCGGGACAATHAHADTQGETNSESSESSGSELEYYAGPVKRRRRSSGEPGGGGAGRRGGARVTLRDEPAVRRLVSRADRQLQRLDHDLVTLLAWQRVQQIVSGEACAGSVPLSCDATRVLTRHLTRTALASHGFRHVSLPSELLSRADRERIVRAVWGAAPASPRAAPASAPRRPDYSLTDACVRATLCALTTRDTECALGPPVPMRLSSLCVGSDSACDVTLDATLCRCVSRHHAVIFMDEVSGHFELINYSEWGTRVNGVLYTCDPSARDVTSVTGEPRDVTAEHAEQDALVRSIRDVVKQKDEPCDSISGDITQGASLSVSCECVNSVRAVSRRGVGGGAGGAAGAWEGSALVGHGALLQFGCRLYVFSITDAAPLLSDQTVPEPAL